MPFTALEIEDIVEGIVEQVFLDKQDDDGVWHEDQLPQNFLQLALVSRAFLNPVRRSIYGDLRIEGPERFLLLTGQLRFSPHLAKFVKSASLVSACSQYTHIDGENIRSGNTPGGSEPRAVSSTALRWFLEACPQLTKLHVSGGDFLWPLSVQDPKSVKITDLTLLGCFRCNPHSPQRCTMAVERVRGWLKHIVAFPHLEELELCKIALDTGPNSTMNPTWGVPSGSSICTGLTLCPMGETTSALGLETLLHAMPLLKELVLDGVEAMPDGQLKKCLHIVAPTLTLLTITDYRGFGGRNPLRMKKDTFVDLKELKQLTLNDVTITPPILDLLPDRLERLRFSDMSAACLPASSLIGWLRRVPFRLLALKKLEFLRVRDVPTAETTEPSEAELAELAQLCGRLGIEWINREATNDFEADFGTEPIEFEHSDDSDGLSALAF